MVSESTIEQTTKTSDKQKSNMPVQQTYTCRVATTITVDDGASEVCRRWRTCGVTAHRNPSSVNRRLCRLRWCLVSFPAVWRTIASNIRTLYTNLKLPKDVGCGCWNPLPTCRDPQGFGARRTPEVSMLNAAGKSNDGRAGYHRHVSRRITGSFRYGRVLMRTVDLPWNHTAAAQRFEDI